MNISGLKHAVAVLVFLALMPGSATAQITPTQEAGDSQGSEVVEKVKDTVAETAGIVKDKANEIGATLDQSEAVAEVSKSILDPIYQAAETAGQYPAFYWCAFTLMAAGVVSFLLQLVLTKFFLLFKMHLNLKEMIMDLVGLLISVAGLVLTTQAASENSESFVQSPSAVISAAAIGAGLGIVFYVWGQRQEFQAAEGRVAAKSKE